MAHKRCLGSSADSLDLENMTFKCGLCMQDAGATIKCEVCLIEGKGMYTRIANYEGEWVHQICGLLCDEYEVTNFATMEFFYQEPEIQCETKEELRIDLSGIIKEEDPDGEE